MSSKLQTFEDINYINEEASEIVFTEGEDIEKLKKLKEVAQKFLLVNDYDISMEPNFEDLSLDQFIEYIQKQAENKLMVTKFDELNIDTTFRSLMSNYYTHKESGNRIFIFFLPDDKRSSNSISIADFKKFITLIFKLDCREGMLISNKDLSSKSKDQVRKCNIKSIDCQNIYNIITYKDDDFVDITSHAFVPEVIAIYRDGKESKKFSEDHSINITKLSRILMNEPLAKFYRGKVGDIFALRRKNMAKKTLLDEQIVYKIIYPSLVNKK